MECYSIGQQTSISLSVWMPCHPYSKDSFKIDCSISGKIIFYLPITIQPVHLTNKYTIPYHPINHFTEGCMGEQATLDFNLTFFFSPNFSPFSHQKKKKIEKNMTNAKKNIFIKKMRCAAQVQRRLIIRRLIESRLIQDHSVD